MSLRNSSGRSAKVCALIPARGGSKRIPRKNLQRLGESTLLEISIRQAKDARNIDEVIVSSDDDEILAVAKECGAMPLLRPQELAADDTPGIAPVLHGIEYLGLHDDDEIVLLQPTSPFRTVSDIDGALVWRRRCDAPFCVTVKPAVDNPAWMFSLDGEGRMRPLLEAPLPARSQDLPRYYVPNGAIYIGRVGDLMRSRSFFTPKTVAYIMPEERSIDIDTPFDLELARLLWNDK